MPGSKKIKVSEIQLPVNITDLDEDKKNKIMTALGVKWRIDCNAEDYPLSGGKYLSISESKQVIKGSTPSSLTNSISYNDIVFNESSYPNGVGSQPRKGKTSIYELKYPCVITNIDDDKKLKILKLLKLTPEKHSGIKEMRLYVVDDVLSHGESPSREFYSQSLYSHYTFYKYEDLYFPEDSESDINLWEEAIYQKNNNGKIGYISKIDTKAPKIVGEYSPAYRKYKPKKGE